MEKGSIVSSLIAGSAMWPEEQVVVSGGLEETTLQTQQSWGWWAGAQRETLGCLLSAIGLTLAVVTVPQPGLQYGYWTVHSECAVGAELHWICTHTHTHTPWRTTAWAKGSTPKSRKRGPYQSTKGYPLSTKLSIMLIIKEKCLESRSFCGAGKREWMWSWEVENKLRTVLGSSFSYSATTYTLTGMLQPV